MSLVAFLGSWVRGFASCQKVCERTSQSNREAHPVGLHFRVVVEGQFLRGADERQAACEKGRAAASACLQRRRRPQGLTTLRAASGRGSQRINLPDGRRGGRIILSLCSCRSAELEAGWPESHSGDEARHRLDVALRAGCRR